MLKPVKKLESRDVFAFIRMLNQIGIREDLRKLAQDSNSIAEAWNKGFDGMYDLFEKAISEHNEQYTFGFLSRFFDCEWKEIAETDPFELITSLKEVAEVENWKTFFKSVSSLIMK